MDSDDGTGVERSRLGVFAYIIGAFSFIPGLGILFGIASVVWGAVTKKEGGRTLLIMGASGIGLSVVLYSALFYFAFMQRGGVYDGLRTQMAESSVTTLVQAIEFYKVQNGHYPDSLETLAKSLPRNTMTFVFDPSEVGFGRQPRYFYYELADDSHYYLLGVGPDGKPFTSDDVLPKIKTGPDSKIGLLIRSGTDRP
ncbi:MAG: hypothetical protein JWR07_3566 [Nevskia sp.]|nr:hypothetical protein [Nevskia sp.]